MQGSWRRGRCLRHD